MIYIPMKYIIYIICYKNKHNTPKYYRLLPYSCTCSDSSTVLIKIPKAGRIQ